MIQNIDRKREREGGGGGGGGRDLVIGPSNRL